MTIQRSIRRGLSLALALTLSTGALLGQDAMALSQSGGMVETLVAQVATAAQAVTNDIQVPQDPYHVTVDSIPLTQDPQLTTLNGVVQASVRVMAEALCPGVSISWNGQSAVLWKDGVLGMTVTPGKNYVEVNGRYFYVSGGIQTYNGTVMLPVDVLMKALGAGYYCFNPDGSLVITSGTGGCEFGWNYYDTNDVYWLSRIIYAESGNQPLTGKLAVGNVVLNRVNSSRFPNTIKEVIFQKNQFSPVKNGTIYRTPSEESVIAAKLCLDGAVALNNVLYFNVKGLKSWASKNRTYVATIASHTFYA